MQDGDRFWRMPECYVRGNTIKYLRIPDEVIHMHTRTHRQTHIHTHVHTHTRR